MKKLFAALALCVSTVAFAQEDTAEKQEKKPEAPSAQQGSRDLELFEATDLRSQKPGSATAKAKEEKRRKDERGVGGSGDDRTVTEKAKDAVGLDDDTRDTKARKDEDTATGGSGRELEQDVKAQARESKAQAREAGEDTRGMARDAARDTKGATKDAAQDVEDAAQDTQNKMDEEMNQ